MLAASEKKIDFQLLYPVAAHCGKHMEIICSFRYIVIKLNCKYGLLMVLLLILDGKREEHIKLMSTYRK